MTIIEDIWSYLYVPPPIRFPRDAVVLVFGRHSPQLVHAVSHVMNVAKPKLLVVSGNVGKDSGSLPLWNISEAHYIISGVDVMLHGRLADVDVDIDLTARNGWENGKRMCEIMRDREFIQPDVITVAHAPQVRRLSAQLRQVSTETGYALGNIVMQPSEYEVDVGSELDQIELLWEFKHMSKYGAPADLKDAAEKLFDELTQGGSRKWSTAGR